MKNLLPISPAVKNEHLFLISDKESYSYGELFSFSALFSDFIKEHEINTGRPLGVHAPSSDALVFIIAACWMHGIPFVPFNPQAKKEFLATQIRNINPGLIITGSPDQIISAKYQTVSTDRFDLSEITARNDRPAKGLAPDSFRHEPDDSFGYFFTSGTSGHPKIVPLKRRQMHTAARASASNLKPEANEAWLLCLPLHHIGGISVILRSLLYGSAIYQMDHFDADAASKLLSYDKRVVTASFVPTMLKRLLDDPGFSTHQSVQAILLGGGPIESQLLQTSIDRTIPVIPSYGMTETCAQIVANPLFSVSDNSGKLNSAGKVFEPNTIEIRDASIRTLSAGESGTIWLKGPQVFDGYRNESNLEYFDENGWFNTGDFGRLDEENRLYIEARRTDLIITGGENVTPDEVEGALQSFDFIKEAAVFGIPDSQWGQKVTAAIILKNQKVLPEKALLHSLKEQLEPYKIPKEFIVVEKLPRTETGKIKRGNLLQLYQSK